MSTAGAMQQAKAETAKPAQHISQSATQSQHIDSSEIHTEFTDLRPQATTQRKLQEAADNSPQSRQLNVFQQMAQNSARSTQLKTMSAMMNAPALQRVEDEETLQAKMENSTVQREEAASAAQKPNNTGLPDNLKSGIESLSGMSMDHVKVHYNSSQPAQLNAHAYAQGSEIHVAPGQEQHVPHEAWHVVQQAQGRVRPTMQMKGGVPVNDDVGLETEADVMGAKALQRTSESQDTRPAPVIAIVLNNSQSTIQHYSNELSPVQLNGIANKLVGNIVSDAILNIGGSIASTFLPASNVPRHGPLTGRGFGSFVEANLVPGQFKEGTRTGGAPGNTTWDSLKLRRNSSGDQLYVQGHLLNFHLGGKGDEWSNLVPLTQKANMKHSSVVEESVKTAANTPGQEVVYRVRPVYGSWPWQWPAAMVNMLTSPLVTFATSGAFGELAKLHEAEQHVPSEIQCDWWVTIKATGRTSAHSAKIQQDYGGSKVYVLYGGQSHDLTNEAWVWNLIEQALAVALRLTLLAGPLGSAARIATQAMTAEQTVVLLRRLVGGPLNGLRTVVDNRFTGVTAAVQIICENYGWGAISAAALDIVGPLPAGTAEAPVHVNRELRATLEDLHPDEIALIETPQARNRRPPT
jgi:hypothetical protein